MARKNLIIELRGSPAAELAASNAGFGMDTGVVANLSRISQFTLDQNFPPVASPSKEDDLSPAAGFGLAAEDSQEVQTYLVRGSVESEAMDDTLTKLTASPEVQGVFADARIEACPTCGGSPPVGNAADVARLLGVPKLAARGMNGRGVLLAVVDTGINLAHLRLRGLTPNFRGDRSWVPASPPGRPPLVPGNLPVGHGTMCAFDALIAAPQATLLDIAVLQSVTPGGSVMEGLLSDAILAYSHLRRVLREMQRPGDFHSLVVNNSWGMFRADWDFPIGHPGNYSDNPRHPFNLIVGTLERAGADILFAAGNCGRECRDGRCGSEIDAGIYGANSHPQVLSVAGVDTAKLRVGYSTRGPGRLDRRKPDICAYTHFAGSGVYPADGGTSAATPVAAGVVAALRTRFPMRNGISPALVRNAVRRTAQDLSPTGFDFEHGFGIVNGSKIALVNRLTLDASGTPEEPELNNPDDYPDEQPIGEATMEDTKFMAALAEFDTPETPGTAVTAGTNLCEVYRKVKPILEGILPFISLIPRIGKPAAAAIKALMAGLNAICGVSSSLAAETSGEGDAFSMALAEFEDAAPVAVGVAAGPVDICSIYKKVKPILTGILPFLALIPKVGKPAAAAIKALMAALDTICPNA